MIYRADYPYDNENTQSTIGCDLSDKEMSGHSLTGPSGYEVIG